VKKLRMIGLIKGGKLVYTKSSKDGEIKYTRFIQKNEGKKIETTIEIIEGIEYWIHQAYRGHLLPAIMEGMGEVQDKENRARIHKWIKWEYMGVKCEKIEDIPENITRKQLVIIDGKLKGYVPSMAHIKQELAKGFIQYCEYKAAEVQGHIKDNYEKIRKEIFR
jgi:hypothetical protein